MTVKILSDDFKLSGMLDNIIFARYNEGAYYAGHAFLIIPFDKSHYEALKPPSRLLIEDMPYTVEKIRCIDDQIEISARGVFHDFSQFALTAPKTFAKKPSEMVCELANGVTFRGIQYGVYGIGDFSEPQKERVEWCTSYERAISALCAENDLCFRMTFDGESRELKFLLDNCVDRSIENPLGYSVISDKRTPFLELELIRDISSYKTRVELLFRISTINGYRSAVIDRTPSDEMARTYTEIVDFPAESFSDIDGYLERRCEALLAAHPKTNELRVRISGKSTHRAGQICYFESERLGESFKALIKDREYVMGQYEEYEELILEVR